MRARKIPAVRWSPAMVVVLILFCGLSLGANQPEVPTVDAGIGSCSAEFHVRDGAGKPLYNAAIKITIKYGFMNLRKAQLEAPTNTNGEARFTGLPNASKKPLQFVVSRGTVSKTVADDPGTNCRARFEVTLTVHQTIESLGWPSQDVSLVTHGGRGSTNSRFLGTAHTERASAATVAIRTRP